ncbi:MAG: TolC family protein [Opitutales bacterium]
MNVRLFLSLAWMSAAGILAAGVAKADSVVLPEKLFPQLDGFLRQAVSRSPRMVSRDLDLDMAAEDRIQARAGLLPSVGGYYNGSEARDQRADISQTINERITNYNFSVTQPVYHWGELRNNARMGEIRDKIAHGQYQEGYRLLAQELRTKYLTLIVQKHGVTRARFNQQFTQEQLRLAEDKLVKKIISDADIFPFRLNAERAGIDLEKADFDYDNARQSFARLAGMEQIRDEDIPEMIPKLAYTAGSDDQLLADFLRLKEPPSFEAYRLRNNIVIQDLNYQNQKTRLRPKLNLVAGTTENQFQYSLFGQQYLDRQYFVGFQLNWTIFDGFASQSAVRAALANKRQQENDYRELVSRLAQDARSAHRQIYFSARTMAINDRFLSDAEGNLKAREDEFKRGQVSEADVNTVKLYLMDSITNAYNSRIDYLTKVGEFLGTLNADPVTANLPVQK